MIVNATHGFMLVSLERTEQEEGNKAISGTG